VRLRKYLRLQLGLEDASLAVAALVTELATVISPAVAILSESWDRLGMHWQTGSKMKIEDLETRWEERLTALRVDRVRKRDLLSTNPFAFFCKLQSIVDLSLKTPLHLHRSN
jgi:hypothetical protein